MAKRSKLTDAGGVLSAAATTAAVVPGAGAPQKRAGRKPDPTRQAFRPSTVMLTEGHQAALLKAAAERVAAGRASVLDKSEVVRLLLDAWVAKGAKAP